MWRTQWPRTSLQTLSPTCLEGLRADQGLERLADLVHFQALLAVAHFVTLQLSFGFNFHREIFVWQVWSRLFPDLTTDSLCQCPLETDLCRIANTKFNFMSLNFISREWEVYGPVSWISPSDLDVLTGETGEIVCKNFKQAITNKSVEILRGGHCKTRNVPFHILRHCLIEENSL